VTYPKIYITGLGTISAAGETVAGSMSHLYAGKRNSQQPQNIQADLDIAYPVFEVFSQRVIANEKTTRTSKLALIAVEEALAQARLNQKDLQGLRIGVAIGTTVGSTLNNEPFYREFKAGKKPGLQVIQKYLTNNPALFIALARAIFFFQNHNASTLTQVQTIPVFIKRTAGLCG